MTVPDRSPPIPLGGVEQGAKPRHYSRRATTVCGNDESLNAQMIVSASNLDPALPGDQHVWIQGIGCGSASVSFGR
jgi:hypothetical protein